MVVLGCNNISYVDRLTSGLGWETLHELDDHHIKHILVGHNNELIIVTDSKCRIIRLTDDAVCHFVDLRLINNRVIYSFGLV